MGSGVRRISLVAMVVLGCRAEPVVTDERTGCVKACDRLTRGDRTNGPDCGEICSHDCAARCEDAMVGWGAETKHCAEICSKTCPELEKTYAMNPELCGWIVENKPSPKYTPRTLRPAQPPAEQ